MKKRKLKNSMCKVTYFMHLINQDKIEDGVYKQKIKNEIIFELESDGKH